MVTSVTQVRVARCKVVVGNKWVCWLENHLGEVVGDVVEERKRHCPVGSRE